MEKSTLRINGEKIAYIYRGEGKPLSLLHSLGASGESWSKVIEPLAQNYAVYSLDMLGHGDSDKPPSNYLIEDYARSVVTFADKLGLEKIILCGNSIGAIIALEIAASQPELVERLILVGCPGWDAWQRTEQLTLSASNFDMEGNPIPNTMESLKMFYTQPNQELLDWVNQQEVKAGLWMKKALVALALYDVLPRLPMVKCPTMALFGEHDMAREQEKNLLGGLKVVKHALVPNAGHLPQIDNPQGFLQEVNKFLSST